MILITVLGSRLVTLDRGPEAPCEGLFFSISPLDSDCSQGKVKYPALRHLDSWNKISFNFRWSMNPRVCNSD